MTTTSVITNPSLADFIEQMNPPTEKIREALYKYPDVIEKLIEEVKIPLPDQIPNEIKAYHNGQLQKWLEWEPHNYRYFVKAVPNFERVPFEDQVYVHYYYDGVLARFGVYQQVLISRLSPNLYETLLKIFAA